MQFISWAVVLIALTGTIANVKKKWWCFIFWIVSNVYLCGYNIYTHEYPQAFLWFVYCCICVYGIITWRKEKNDQ